jgi:hypothetical protein
MVNDFADLPYTIADRPMSGRTVVRTYPYDGWLRRDGEVLLLKRAAVQAVTARSVTGLVVTQPAAPRATVLIGDGDTASANVRLPDRP